MREAVAAIFSCGEQLYSIRRQTTLRAFPGYHAFPGGKIDEGDESISVDHAMLNEFPKEQTGALIREIREELGFDIVLELGGLVKSVKFFALTITPKTQKIRFRLHVYRIELSELVEFTPDINELEYGYWTSAQTLWEQFERGEGLMVNTTSKMVKALAEDIHCDFVDCRQPELTDTLYMQQPVNGVGIFMVPSNTLPPATTTNALFIGDEGSPRILTDPSPKNQEVFNKLLNTLRDKPPTALLLTHQHPDHHERLPELAKTLDIPVLCTEITYHYVQQRFGGHYFKSTDIRFIQDGDVITQWLGHPVICRSLPGHDEGMVGLAPDNMAWFYVADLVEAGTSVVIPEPEGNMQDYFDTLERTIALKPEVVIASHGIAQGGTYLLESTLVHRQKREQQIAETYESGMTDETALLDSLYPGLDAFLKPFAAQNIRQHLRKLGKINSN